MTLVISSRHSLETLEKLVRNLFSAVVNKSVVLPALGDPTPYKRDTLGNLIKFVPIHDNDILTIKWILPYFEKDLKRQPLFYFCHLFGHEGKNSLLSYLISEGLAVELSASSDHELWTFSTFSIDIALTESGLQNYE